MVDLAIAVGLAPERTLRAVRHQATAWYPERHEPVQPMRIIAQRRNQVRHLRKYAEGGRHYHSFHFRRPGQRGSLKAHNLNIFAQIAEGIDEETWLFHLGRGDYSLWFRDAAKVSYLADQTERLSDAPACSPTKHAALFAA